MKKLEKFKNPLIFIIVVLFTINIIFFKYRIAFGIGESMEPTHHHGEWIIAEKVNNSKNNWSPERFDVILVKDKSNDNLSKRIIGLPRDTIEIKEGVIFLNEHPLDDPFGQGKIGTYLVDENGNRLKYWNGPEKGKPIYSPTSISKITIPRGNVWVIGDNREMSWYGILPIKNIKGLIIL